MGRPVQSGYLSNMFVPHLENGILLRKMLMEIMQVSSGIDHRKMKEPEGSSIYEIPEAARESQRARCDVPVCYVVAWLSKDRDVEERNRGVQPSLLEVKAARFVLVAKPLQLLVPPF